MDASISREPEQVPRLGSGLSIADHIGALVVRLGFGRDRYCVAPGLYRIGGPDRLAPVLVTANYKLTVDTLRRDLHGRSVWLLVLDTRGVNVWCAAGKGTFGTDELIIRLLESGLQSLVDHRTLVLPQLGAPGVAAHVVRRAVGFRVVYGPVRSADLPAFLDAGLEATPAMRRVRFTLRDRFVVTGVELAVLRDVRTLAALAVLMLGAAAGLLPWGGVLMTIAAIFAGVLAGGLLVPIVLPWLPGRLFAQKGALAGALVGVALLGVSPVRLDAPGTIALLAGVTVLASFTALNFTGATTFTSPSGVAREMRIVIPFQAGAALVAVAALVVAMVW